MFDSDNVKRIGGQLHVDSIALWRQLVLGRADVGGLLQGVLVVTCVGAQLDELGALYREVADVQAGGGALGLRVDNLDDELARLVVDGGTREDTCRRVVLQHGVEHQIFVEPGLHRVAADGQRHVIPAASLDTSLFDVGLDLAATAYLFDGMLCVAPSAEVQPAVVMLVHVVEDDDEALGTLILAGTELAGVVV